MKKIALKNVTKFTKSKSYPVAKSHTIGFGNGITVRFTNYRKAEAFLSLTNQFLNRQLFDLNDIYCSVFTQYRFVWFSLDKVPNDCFIKLQLIEKCFDLMVDRAHWVNGNHFTFKHFYTIIGELKFSISLMQDFLKEKNTNFTLIHSLSILTNRLDLIEKSLNTWGKEFEGNALINFKKN